MPPPASKSASSVDRTPEQLLERQDRLRREWEEQQRKREEEALRKKQQEEEARRRREEEEALRKKREAEALQKKQQEEAAARKKQEQEQEQEALRKAQQPRQSKSAQPMPPPRPPPERAPSQPSATQEPTQSEPAVSQTQEHVIDNVQRVPDEHLPSHQDRQRSNLEKRFTALMDELLPKIAVVTQKVNTYTGTDYSGVEALRREIKEQGTLLSKYPQVAILTTCRETRQSSPSCD
jgi:sensitive to high expression protein 9